MEKDGLLDHVIYGCLEDNAGNLWLSASSGLIKLDIATESFRHYDASDGLRGNQFNGGAYFKSPDGELFFGGSHGLNSFFPEAIEENSNKPAINVSVNVDFKEIAEVDSTTEQEMPIKLSYSTEIISFQFAALDFTYPEKNQYRYMLKGIDKKWVYSGTERTVNYLHLKPGEYELHVLASNNDGAWNEEGVSVRFVLTTPLTGFFWFRAIIGLGVFTFMLFIAKMWLTARKKT
jgi:ligand-binding sensor domain-containing protein